MAQANPGNQQGQRLATLYVGDLSSDVSEPTLFDFFSKYGQVASVRVCRDMNSQSSLGYGYVNFVNHDDASRALDTLNYTPLRQGGRPMRLMWYQRDPTLRRTGLGNIFVKDLNKDVDDRQLSEIFREFGPILSSKVSRDKEGKSNGYGFVQFEREDSAKDAINKMNGLAINGAKIFVGSFKRRRERDQEAESSFSNVFFRNLLPELTNDTFIQALAKFGSAKSVCLRKSDKFKTQYAFADFDNHEHALKAINDCNGKVVSDLSGTETLFATRALKRRDRQRAFQMERITRNAEFQQKNLYIKNIPETIDDARLKEMFAVYGDITSAAIRKDSSTGQSKGFGFVAFKSKDAADKAIAAMNNKLMDGKPLYVAFHQTQAQRLQAIEQRRSNPAASYRQWGGGFGAPQQPPMPQVPMYGGYGAPWGAQPMMYPYPGMRVPMNPMGKGPVPFPGANFGGRLPMPSQQRPNNRPQQNQQGVPAVNQQRPPAQGGARAPSGAQGGKMQARPAANKNIPGHGLPTLTSSALAAMSSEEQKNALGERLYARIYAVNPEQAAKITGMLLEMDTTEILNVLEDDQGLRAKIEEAIVVLRAHQEK